jgi:hypothetical protein
VTPHGMALVHQLFKYQFEDPDRASLEEVTNRSQKLGFAAQERKLSKI